MSSPAPRDELKFLTELKKRQAEVTDAASNVWGMLNESHGAKLLEQFVREGRIQSFVLAYRGSALDSSGVDALLLLWDHSYMPLNFKSSEEGRRHHEKAYGRLIPSLVVNSVSDPDCANARHELMRAISGWYGNYAFENSTLIPCLRLRPGSSELKQLYNDVRGHLDGLQAADEPFRRLDGEVMRLSCVLHLSYARRQFGYVSAGVLFANGPTAVIEFYPGLKLLGWAGKRKHVLVTVPPATPQTAFKEALAEGLARAHHIPIIAPPS